MAERVKRPVLASAADRLRTSANAEKRLLREERDAEEALIEAQARLTRSGRELAKIQDKHNRRARVVEAAVGTLAACQRARAAGPDGSTGLAEVQAAASSTDETTRPTSDASPKPAPAR